jgi:FixJ family two-component response regulator
VTKPIVHVVDDDDDMRTALARLLRAEGYDVRTHASAGDFLMLPADAGPACVLLDLAMPGPSGLDLQQALQRDAGSLPIVFITGRGDVVSSVRAMKAGAVDFLTKPVEPAVLIGAVEAALARERSERSHRTQFNDAKARFGRLTQRERAVLEFVIAGRLNKQIADVLGISERTVKMHRANVMAKMGARSLAELVQLSSLLGRDTDRAASPPPQA